MFAAKDKLPMNSRRIFNKHADDFAYENQTKPVKILFRRVFVRLVAFIFLAKWKLILVGSVFEISE